MSSGPPSTIAHIAGVGARTAVGLQARTTVAAVHASVSRIGEHPYMVDKDGKPFMIAMDRTFDAHDRHERMYHLARSALRELLRSFSPPSEGMGPIFLGLPESGEYYQPAHADALCCRIAADLVGHAPVKVTPILAGNAAGHVAMERAVQGIARGTFEWCVVAGVDSWIDPDVLERLDQAGRVTSESNRWGFPPGEGAGALLVCHPTFTRRHRLIPLARVVSVAVTHEPASMGSRAICVGKGLADALRRATAGLGVKLSRQYCDIDGERYREHEFSYAILRIPDATFVDALDYKAVHGAWGQLGAASGPLLTTLPLLTHSRGFSPGSWPVVWCGSEGGLRGAMVLHLDPGAP